MSIVISAASCVTAVGHCARSSAAAVHAGISRLGLYEDYVDSAGNPIIAAPVVLDDPAGDSEHHEARVRQMAQHALARLLGGCGEMDSQASLAILAGVCDQRRPGPRYEGEEREFCEQLSEQLREQLPALASPCRIEWFEHGNAAVFAALRAGIERITRDPDAQCIVGGFDSLLDPTTLDWLELKERLKSDTFGRNHGLPPGEAAAFFLLESAAAAQRRGRRPLARVHAVGLAQEPGLFIDDVPSRAQGMSAAVRQATAGISPGGTALGSVFVDLNGEFHRAQEWSQASVRCLQRLPQQCRLWHPAECFGDVGSAWGAVAACIAAIFLEQRNADELALCVAADDFGWRGAAVLGGVGQ